MLTPTVAGTVIMLIAVTVMPIVFAMLTDVPADAPPFAAPVSALATALAIIGLALKASGPLRLWAPVIGVITGSLVAGAFGLYDVASAGRAAWVGIPNTEWPGLDLSFGPVFWALLPAFVFVTLVGAIETIGEGVAIQRVSWRRPRAVDFRAVQGAVAADGAGNLLSGLAGTVPNTTYSTSVAVTELTGVGARGVGVAIGIIFFVLAFLPKALAVVLAIPPPVAAAYITVLLAMLFVTGMKMIIQDRVDYRKGLIVGVSFWAGVGFQNGVIFPAYFAEFAGGLLQNGMTAGGLVAILMTLFMELTAPAAAGWRWAPISPTCRRSRSSSTPSRRATAGTRRWHSAWGRQARRRWRRWWDRKPAAARIGGGACCWSGARKTVAPCSSSSSPPARTTSRTA